MFVINIVGPSYFYVDNEYVVNSLTMADSWLKGKNPSNF